MLYHVSRNGQNYGPYTLEDLRRYVATGNMLATDLAKSDEMAEWLPVSQILGMPAPGTTAPSGAAPSNAAPSYAAPSYAAPSYAAPAYPSPFAPGAPGVYPDSPNLSWGLVLLFSFFTCGLFMLGWNIVLASWMKRVQPNSKALLYYIAGTILLIINIGAGRQTGLNFHTGTMGLHSNFVYHPLASLIGLATWVVRLIARYTMRSSLEEHFNGPEPVGLSLSGVMTFFFGGLYFQYHLNRINELKRASRYRGVAI